MRKYRQGKLRAYDVGIRGSKNRMRIMARSKRFAIELFQTKTGLNLTAGGRTLITARCALEEDIE